MVRSLPPSKLRARRRKRRFLFAGLGVLLVVLLAGGVAALTWLPHARVAAVSVVGAESVAPSAVEEIVHSSLAGAYAGVLARSNIFLYPKEEIRSRIAKKFPVFSSVEVTAEDFTSLQVSVVERKPEAVWCGESVASSSACFLLDAGGLAYTPAADFTGALFTRYFGEAVGTPRQYLTPGQFRSLWALVESFKSQGVGGGLESVEVDAVGVVRARFSNGFMLMFTLSDSGADVLERFNLALTADPFTTHALHEFEYLDLRFGDSLYYKLRVEEEAIQENTEASQVPPEDGTLAE